ncbi:MAG: cysteine desulfurase family protein, partial [Nitrospinales bacterium]
SDEIAEALRLPSYYRIIFTSGGSESNNLFIKGTCFPDKKTACLGLEHPSVTSTLDYFKEFGNPPLILRNFQEAGRLNPTAVPALQENRIRLLCLSHVNNELGSVNGSQQFQAILKEGSSQTRLFLDGVQAVGKLKLDRSFWETVSGYSISGHKINGPKGIGLLAYDSRLPLAPQIHGGKQQFGVRSGTLPVPLILGLAESVKRAAINTEETQAHLKKLFRHLITGLHDLSDRVPHLQVRINSSSSQDINLQSPAIVNFSFPPVEGEVLLHHLEEKEIYVGLGSACSSHSKESSKILTGIGLTEEEARCSLRISFSRQNSLKEIDTFLEEFARAYQSLYPTFSKQTEIK